MKEYYILAKSLEKTKGQFWHRVLIAENDLKMVKETYLVKEIKIPKEVKPQE